MIERLVKKLSPFIIELNGNSLYSVNNTGTMMLKFKLDEEYPKAIFSSKSWEDGFKIQRIRSDYILVKKKDELIRIPLLDLKLDLANGFEQLKQKCRLKFIDISPNVMDWLKKRGQLSPFITVSISKDKKTIIYKVLDTSSNLVYAFPTQIGFGNRPGVTGLFYLPRDVIFIAKFDISTAYTKIDDSYEILYVDAGQLEALFSLPKVKL